MLINKNNGSENVQVHRVSELPKSFMVTTLYNRDKLIAKSRRETRKHRFQVP